jgi:5-methylcytosine-specific restriction protein A
MGCRRFFLVHGMRLESLLRLFFLSVSRRKAVLGARMPGKWKTVCRAAGCMTSLVTPGYCDKHTHLKREPWATTRTSSHARGYGFAWTLLRKQVMTRDKGLCQVCWADHRIGLATEVDHIVAKAKGGSDDLANLQSICHACHVAKTAGDRKKMRG